MFDAMVCASDIYIYISWRGVLVPEYDHLSAHSICDVWLVQHKGFVRVGAQNRRVLPHATLWGV